MTNAKKVDIDDEVKTMETEAQAIETTTETEAPAIETTTETKAPTNVKKVGRRPISEDEKKRRRNVRDRMKREREKKDSEKIEKTILEENEIEDVFNQHNATQANILETEIEVKQEENKALNRKISGMILLTVIDAFLPLLLLKIAGMVNKKFKTKKAEEIKLTQEEKQELSEIADEVAGMIDASPVLLLSISLGGIYFSKLTL